METITWKLGNRTVSPCQTVMFTKKFIKHIIIVKRVGATVT